MQKFKLKLKNRGKIIGAFLCLTGLIMLVMNFVNMYGYLKKQSIQQGETELRKIAADMHNTLDKSRRSLLRISADVEVLLAMNADDDRILSYLESQSKIFRDQSGDSFMNVFVCTADKKLISPADVPKDYDVAAREWYYPTIKNGIDNIYITAPYSDLFTDGMCYTAAVLLSDGKTIAAMDFDLTLIQEMVDRLHEARDGEAIVINGKGLVVGYSDDRFMGQRVEDVLPEYGSVYRQLSDNENDFTLIDAYINGKDCSAFCSHSGDWFLIYTVQKDTMFSEAKKIMLLNFIPRILLILAMAGYYVYMQRFRHIIQAEKENLIRAKKEEKASGPDDTRDMTRITNKKRNGIMIIMSITMTLSLVFTGVVLENWGSDRMERNIDSYSFQLQKWMNTQLTSLNMFVDTISANPHVLDDYDYAVDYLDRIVSNYPEISAAYIARPGNEHEMTMNNGWVPNADYIVAERQWYIETVNSDDGMSVSSPYLDARTGLYCVTFSRVVRDAKTGEQIGVFALDFYIENLTGIMEASYSESGYAFLVDNSGIIVNHPNPEYQISGDHFTGVKDTEYSSAVDDTGIHFISDYDGKLKVCISSVDSRTGFSVIAVKGIWSVYGIVTAVGAAFIILLAVCIVLLYKLIVKMMNWQEQARIKLMEEARRASQADHAKSSFLAQMSHEIRTPINAVLGMNEMILRESKEENIINYASNAYNSGSALLSIINDILDISKIEAGRLEINETEYDIYSLISNCYHMTANRAEKKKLEFKVSCDEKLPVRLKGDMFHIRQIAVNLITNAIKYTDEGSVKLAFSGIENDSGFILCISVKDTGIGLKPENLDKLFTDFQRFDLERNQSVEGTGLGLSICKQLALLMGGNVKAESVYGEGSTFMCTIPQKVIDRRPVGVIQLDHPEKISIGQDDTFTAPDARILVVDDVEMNLLVFTNFLKGHELQISTAQSGRECLELVSENDYDVIFMDHMMPEMDGLETFAKMRELGYNKDTPVIMLTANAISGEEQKYLELGFASYLTKPVNSLKLVEALLKYIPSEKIRYEKAPRQSAGSAVTAAEARPDMLIDVDMGLSYSGESTYYKLLKMFLDKGDENIEKINTFIEKARWEDYITEVHGLKSASLLIGCQRLSEAAQELEMAGKQGDYELIREKSGGFKELYRNVIAEGEEILRNRKE